MLQKFIPEIIEGDYRILIINGQPFHKALARIPQDGSFWEIWLQVEKVSAEVSLSTKES